MLDMETDFHGWLLDQAAALRARDYESLDWDHLAEELELMGARERRELRSELKILLLHLLKLRFQPGQLHRHHSWRNSIVEAREQLADITKDSPGIFQGKRDEVLADVYVRARNKAARESRLPSGTFPEACPWRYEQIIDPDFFPGGTKT
jgi:type II secretory pathway component PulM